MYTCSTKKRIFYPKNCYYIWRYSDQWSFSQLAAILHNNISKKTQILTLHFVVNMVIVSIALNIFHGFRQLWPPILCQWQHWPHRLTQTTSSPVEWPHNLRLLRSDSFQSEHVPTPAAMERGGDPASEKYCHIHLMCIQSMRLKQQQQQQQPAWLLDAGWRNTTVAWTRQ